MPTRTIEYTEEVTKEENVVVCSDCGREIDENGKQFKNGRVELDFCSECLRKYGEDVHTDEFIERVEDWYEMEDEAGDTMLLNIKAVQVTSTISVLGLLVIGLAIFLYPSVKVGVLGALLLLILLLNCLINCSCSHVLERPEWLRER
jgi:uncharacterized membrane protein